MIKKVKSIIKAIVKRKSYMQNIDPFITYYNYFPIDVNKVQDIWLAKFITHNFKISNRVNLFSVFGNKDIVRFVKSPKIFFTGENIHTKIVNAHFDTITTDYFKKFDLALGFDYVEEVSQANYQRFPLWLMYLFPFNSSYEDIKRILNTYNSPDYRLRYGRSRFASNISRHDNNGIRGEIIDILNNIAEIECAGDFRNNTDSLRMTFDDDKIKYLSTVRFNICPENSDAPGYVTEKVFESIQAGCIPVYWGSGNNPEPHILNSDAILFFNRENPNLLYNQVYSLENNSELYSEFIHRKPFIENAEDVIWEKFEALRKRLKMILKQ